MPGEPVVVATVQSPAEAQLLRIQLEEAGIPARLLDEGMMQANPTYGLALGGIRLVVPASEVERARAVLEKVRGRVAAERRCPECGESEVTQVGKRRRVAWLSVLLLGFPLPPGKAEWQCDACGHAWRAR